MARPMKTRSGAGRSGWPIAAICGCLLLATSATNAVAQTDAAVPDLDRLAKAGDPVARLSRMLIAQTRDEPEVLHP